ncbi:hypothetical protein F4775DRAFT_596504 [Biscogniauxia sp. FL1348]|nr:hypothetical protein F4775DRAFT_596504 [Biscogniauxia sp. FL1348]
MSHTPPTPPTLSLLTLPLELREEIYRHVLGQATPIFLRHYRSSSSQIHVPPSLRNQTQQISYDPALPFSSARYVHAPLLSALRRTGTASGQASARDTARAASSRACTALLCVSRAVHAEALPVLYRASRLVIDDPHHGAAWLAQHRDDAAAWLREVSVWVPRGLYANSWWEDCLMKLPRQAEARKRLVVRVFVETPSEGASPEEGGLVWWRHGTQLWADLLANMGMWAQRVEFGYFDEFQDAMLSE